MDLHDDVHVVTTGLTGGGDTLHGALQVVLTVAAADLIALGGPDRGRVILAGGGENGVDLHGVVALGHGVLDHVVVVLGILEQHEGVVLLDLLAPAELELRSVGTQLLVGLAAQQLVDRQAQGLALDVPAGGVDGGHSGGDDHTAAHAPEGVAVEVLPDLLSVEGIHADDQLGEVLALAPGGLGALAVGQAGLAPTVDTLVGVDLHGDESTQLISAQVAFDAGNFHKIQLLSV